MCFVSLYNKILQIKLAFTKIIRINIVEHPRKDWRPRMKLCQEVAWELQKMGCIIVCQKGKPVQYPTKGPIRLKYNPDSDCS